MTIFWFLMFVCFVIGAYQAAVTYYFASNSSVDTLFGRFLRFVDYRWEVMKTVTCSYVGVWFLLFVTCWIHCAPQKQIEEFGFLATWLLLASMIAGAALYWFGILGRIVYQQCRR